MSNQSLPKPVVKKMRWPFPVIWIVPILAVGAAAFYFYLHHKDEGVTVTITLPDVDGLKPDQTPLRVRGLDVGKVKSMEMDEDHRHVKVKVALQEKNAWVAAADSIFWVVRPDISESGVSGLSTVVSGPYLECLPGGGNPAYEFKGLEKQPVMVGQGVRIILHVERLEKLQVGSPVHFRGIQVGVIQDVRLSDDATQANLTAFIWNRYRNLVRGDSEFWTESGAAVSGGVFTGIKMKLESLRSLISGGVTFSTPTELDAGPAADGAEFLLHDEAKKEWLAWAPKIPIDPAASADEDNKPALHLKDVGTKSAK